MKITKLEQQKNIKSRINVYLDGEFWRGISADTVVACDLFVEKELDRKALENLSIKEDYQNCLSKAYSLLSRRLQSEKELRIKLLKNFDFYTINKTVQRLKELDYVNDMKFADSWIQSRISYKSKRQIEQELIQKGMESSLIKEKLSNIPREIEIETARKIISQKKYKNIPKEKVYQKLGEILTRKGFDYSIIYEMINEYKKSCN